MEGPEVDTRGCQTDHVRQGAEQLAALTGLSRKDALNAQLLAQLGAKLSLAQKQ